MLTSARDAAGEIRAKAEAAARADHRRSHRGGRRDPEHGGPGFGRLIAETQGRRATPPSRGPHGWTAAAPRPTKPRRGSSPTVRQVRRPFATKARPSLARARADGEAALAAARQEGRVMVAEAQAVRERVLRDLAVRRKRTRQQVEKLAAGRERLLEAYDVVRRTVGEATDELTTSLIDASTGGRCRRAAAIDDEPEQTLAQLDEEVANAGSSTCRSPRSTSTTTPRPVLRRGARRLRDRDRGRG